MIKKAEQFKAEDDAIKEKNWKEKWFRKFPL
jgi:hypothetical protein